LALTVTLILGWAIGSAHLPPLRRPVKHIPSPLFAADDGLPAELVTGQQYTARFTVTFPADWPTGQSSVLAMFARGRPEKGGPEVQSIYCSGGAPNAAGTTSTIDCPLTAPDPGPFDLTLSAAGGFFIGSAAGDGSAATGTEHVYHHTVIAGP
jgi:hypothetical protein